MTEYFKYLAILLGLLAGYPLAWSKRSCLGLEKAWQVGLTCLGFTVCSVLSAMAFAMLESLISGGTLSPGAISTYGIYFVCPIPLLAAAKAAGKDGRSWLDVFALYAMPSLFFLRINCLLSGCCGGRRIGATDFHWPTREVELIFYVAMLLVLLRRERAGAVKGTAFPLLMVAYGLFRFAEEWFREGGTGLLHLAHGWSAIACIVGLGLYLEIKENSKRGKSRGERGALKC